MRIEIDKKLAVTLLKAVKRGHLDTSEIPELQRELDLRRPGRVLSIQEIKELIDELENEY